MNLPARDSGISMVIGFGLVLVVAVGIYREMRNRTDRSDAVHGEPDTGR